MNSPTWILPEGVAPTPLAFREALATLPETVAVQWWIANAGVVPVLDWSMLALAGRQIISQLSREADGRVSRETDSVSLWLAMARSPGGKAGMEEMLLAGVLQEGGVSSALANSVWCWWAEAWAATRLAPSGKLFELIWGVIDKRGGGLEAASGIIEIMQSLLSDTHLAALYPLSSERTLLGLVCAPGAEKRLWGAILEDGNAQLPVDVLLVGATQRHVRQDAAARERLLCEMVFEIESMECARQVMTSTDEGHAFWVEACRRAFTGKNSSEASDMFANAMSARPFTPETLFWLASSRNAEVRQWAQMEIVPRVSL